MIGPGRVAVMLYLFLGPVGAARPVPSGGNVRGGARTSVNANRNPNVNQNINRNVNVNASRDVNVHVQGGYGYHGGCCYHPVARAAAVTATTVATAAVVGSIVHSLPPSCTGVVISGVTYQQCGSTWYQPQLSGSTTNYVVVNPPQ